MKRFTGISTVITLFFISIACHTDFNKKSSSHENALAAEKALSARVYLGISEGRNVVALLEGVPEYDSTFFVLQTAGSVAGNFPAVIENVQVQYAESGDCVSFIAQGSNQVQLKLAGTSGCGSAQLQFEGYGLALVTNGDEYAPLLAAFNNQEPLPQATTCRCVYIGEQVNCDSGGEGATECEITDAGTVAGISWNHHCKVKCHDAYYACCTK